MKKYILILAVILVLSPVYTKAQNAAKTAQDEAAIRTGVEQMMSGWNAKSGEQFAKPFAEDADYVVINGMHIKGREAIAKGHQGIFDAVYKNSNLTLNVESIRFLRADIAVVHVRSELKMAHNGTTDSGTARITLTMIKEKSDWKIAAFQNTHIQNP